MRVRRPSCSAAGLQARGCQSLEIALSPRSAGNLRGAPPTRGPGCSRPTPACRRCGPRPRPVRPRPVPAPVPGREQPVRRRPSALPSQCAELGAAVACDDVIWAARPRLAAAASPDRERPCARPGRGAHGPRPRERGRGGGPGRGHVSSGITARLISCAARGRPRAQLQAFWAATLLGDLLPRRARGRAPLARYEGAARETGPGAVGSPGDGDVEVPAAAPLDGLPLGSSAPTLGPGCAP